jgi:hypothetical protein
MYQGVFVLTYLYYTEPMFYLSMCVKENSADLAMEPKCAFRTGAFSPICYRPVETKGQDSESYLEEELVRITLAVFGRFRA